MALEHSGVIASIDYVDYGDYADTTDSYWISNLWEFTPNISSVQYSITDAFPFRFGSGKQEVVCNNEHALPTYSCLKNTDTLCASCLDGKLS